MGFNSGFKGLKINLIFVVPQFRVWDLSSELHYGCFTNYYNGVHRIKLQGNGWQLMHHYSQVSIKENTQKNSTILTNCIFVQKCTWKSQLYKPFYLYLFTFTIGKAKRVRNWKRYSNLCRCMICIISLPQLLLPCFPTVII